MVNDAWLDLFENAKAESFFSIASDHLPLALWPIPSDTKKGRRNFKFENVWLREKHCREILQNTWAQTRGFSLQYRLDICSHELWEWGKNRIKNFQPHIIFCKKQLESLRDNDDARSSSIYNMIHRNLSDLMYQQHIYWKQRAKSFWLKGGDSNSKYFHASVRKRRRNNQIKKLRDNHGGWVHKGP